MANITPTAAAAREGARTVVGQFGEQEHSAPELALQGQYEPGQPLIAMVTFEEYESHLDDFPVETYTQQVDVANLLDSFSLSDFSDGWDDAGLNDRVTELLQERGEVAHPELHARTEIPGAAVEAYFAYRESNGLEDPIATEATPSVMNLSAAQAERKRRIAGLREQLADETRQLEEAEELILSTLGREAHSDAAILVAQIDNQHRPVELYGADQMRIDIGEVAEEELADKIRAALGDDPSTVGSLRSPRTVILSAGAGFTPITPGRGPWVDIATASDPVPVISEMDAFPFSEAERAHWREATDAEYERYKAYWDAQDDDDDD